MIDGNLAAHPAQAMSRADVHRLQAAQLTSAINAYPGATTSAAVGSGGISAATPFRKAPRLHIQVDKVTNGFVLAVGDERLIAKDLEELQALFVSQVASMLLEDK